MKVIKFYNSDLTFDIEEIESFDVPITVSKEFDPNLDYPYAIDVEDNSYWYPDAECRDSDFELLETIVPHFSFIHL